MSNTNEREDLIAGLREHATFMCIEGAEKQRTLKAADMLEADLQDFETYSKIIKSATSRERQTRETLRKLLANRQAQQVVVPEGNWLWCKLMDFCKKRGYAPADFDDLFAIVKEARAKQVSVPRVKVELPDGDERVVKTWFTEMINGELVVSISVDTKEVELTTNQSQTTWKAEQIDDFEIRVTSPEGESWRLRSADRNDIFNNFIWRWAESLVNKGE